LIIALAGRRIDDPDEQRARFPLANVDIVTGRLRDLFRATQATVLVSSAACGADLLALSEAGAAGMRRRIVLPFDRERFRRVSVTDRPGDWGPLFDRVADEVTGTGDLVVLEGTLDDSEAFAAANRLILDEAAALAVPPERVSAVLVWDGRSRGNNDLTGGFGDGAKERGLPVFEVKTL
jgi:hypothetical protein